MKPETAQKKLAKMLGLEQHLDKHVEKKKNKFGNLTGITEDEIQAFREVQGLIYFLQAPELFTARVCQFTDCGQPFLVSRKFVAYCSYTCIEKSMKEAWGTTWTYSGRYEDAAVKLYEKNEPLWIRNMAALKTCLEWLTAQTTQDTEVPSSMTFLLPSVKSAPEEVLTSSRRAKSPAITDPMAALDALLSSARSTL